MKAKNSSINLIQITDCHLFANKEGTFNGVDTRSTFVGVINNIASLKTKPNFIVATGDISQDCSEESYHFFAQTTQQLNIPIFWMAGNHDDMTTMTNVLNGYEHMHFKKHTLLGNWQLIFLETNRKGQCDGKVYKSDVELIKRLSYQKNPLSTLIVVHHNVLHERRKGVFSGLTNSQEFTRFLLHFKHIKLVVSGHIHQDLHQKRKHISFLTTRSTGFQSKSKSGRNSKETPGYRQLHLSTRGQWTTKVVSI